MLETLDYTIRIGSTPTFLYFDLYLYSAYAARYVYELQLAPLLWDSTWVRYIQCYDIFLDFATLIYKWYGIHIYNLIMQ